MKNIESENKTYRPDLPRPIPARILALPVERGYPVPFFADQVDGHYDFRIVDGRKLARCVRDKLCWICGQPLGRYLTFAIGPMCVINRISAEPPSHRECAEWSARACPFLTLKEPERRDDDLPADAELPAGHMIRRNPGVILLWITRDWKFQDDGTGGKLFRIGEPRELVWMAKGRIATREEILQSIESGYPELRRPAEALGPHAVAALEKAKQAAMCLLPSQ